MIPFLTEIAELVTAGFVLLVSAEAFKKNVFPDFCPVRVTENKALFVWCWVDTTGGAAK